MKPTLSLPRPSTARMPGPPQEPEAPGQEITLPSSRLLQGRKSVQIEHNGALYQLRATKFGKLILTK
jgi:hemin uptake protein HemP